MKGLILLLTLTLGCVVVQAQDKFALKADYDFPEEPADLQMEYFHGIEKLKFTLNEKDKALLNGKNYRLIIKEYQNGKIFNELLVIDTESEGLQQIDPSFEFSLITQHILNYEKVGFFFPRFLNKKIFNINKEFKDGDFSLRKINIDTEALEFELNKPFQIALITPPNSDPNKGNLGYCEVSQGGIVIEDWYAKYKIPQFFLVYMEVK